MYLIFLSCFCDYLKIALMSMFISFFFNDMQDFTAYISDKSNGRLEQAGGVSPLKIGNVVAQINLIEFSKEKARQE